MQNFRSLLNISISAFIFLVFTAAAIAQPVPSEYLNGLKWRSIGPFRGGRVVAVAGVPGDATTAYFGSVDGGIWKTIDSGIVWTPIFDGQPVGSIGALAIAPSDSKVIYAGTGESDIREDLSTGIGVYKSTDGGTTWSHIGLEDTRQISRIVVDPKDANVVYVGALGHAYAPNKERGVFKSTDGGAHWTHALDLGPEIGVSDLAIATASPQLLFAGAWQTRRPPWTSYPPIDGPGSGIYRSRDGGSTWTYLEGNGLPPRDWGRVGVDVSPDGQRVYALIEVKKPNAEKSGLYRSDDGGDTWTLANSDTRLTSRAWYFNRVTIDPNNPDVLYMPNMALYRSEDGGKTVSVLRGAPGGDDYHQMWVDPKNSSRLVLGTDQGTTISLNRGQTWSSWYNQPTAQFYHVTADNQFPYSVYGAQQDSGAAATLSRTDHHQITPRDWFLPGPSESGYLVVDPKDPNIIYLSATYGPVSRFNRRTGLSQDISPWPAFSFQAEINQRKYREPWTPVLVLSPADQKTLYLGSQFVMKTVDGGLHWTTISGDLTGTAPEGDATKTDQPTTPANADAAKRDGYGVVFSIAPSPLNADLIWAGSDTGLIHITRDGSKTWKDVSPPALTSFSKISMIEASHFDPAVAYAAIDRGRLDDQTPYLYRTRDYGATWELMTNGLSAPAFLRSVREDEQTKGLLFAGTEFGVYISFDDGDHWQSLQLNLPIASTRDLVIHGDDLIVATFGRSFWVLDDIAPLRQMTKAAKTNGAWLYRPATAIRMDNDSFPGTPIPPEEPTAQNPPDGAMIDYFLPSGISSVQLEIFDAQQNLIAKISSEDARPPKHPALPIADRWFPQPSVLEKTAGAHRYVWDMLWGRSDAENLDEESEIRNPKAPKVVPGTYQIRLTVDGKTQEQSLNVVMDPRSSASSEVLAQQFRVSQKIYGEAVKARRALAELNAISEKLKKLPQQIDPTKPGSQTQLKQTLTAARSEIDTMLTGSPSNSETVAPGLHAAYSALVSALQVVEGGDREIPSQALAVYDESSGQVKTRIAEWEQFKQTKLPKLNQQLREAGLSPISVAKIEQEADYEMSQ